MPDKLIPTKSRHYFVSSILNWSADEDMFRALERVKRMDGKSWHGASVFRVKGPVTMAYEIEHYRPVVDDALIELIDCVQALPADEFVADPEQPFFMK